MHTLEIINIILSLIAFTLLSFQLIFSFLFFKRKNKNKNKIISPNEDVLHVSVLIPYYNENNQSIQDTINSIENQQNVICEIILVNDGNPKPAIITSKYIKINHIHLKKNMGKRYALYYGAKLCHYDYLVVVDSDTILKENAIIKLYNALISENAGSVCGNILVKNENQNLLTSVIAAMYWFAFNMERSSQSFFGSQIVCSGALSMYLRKPYVQFSESLIKQQVLGIKCVAGDDRHMTNQFIMNGYRSTWEKEAIAWTTTPHTLKSFIKQQIRWTRSFCLEVAWILPRINKFKLIHMLFIFKSLYKYFYLFCLYIVFCCLLTSSHYPLPYLLVHMLLGFLIFASFKGLLSFVITKKFTMFLKTIGFAILGYMLLSPFLLYAALTFWKTSWLTRNNNIL